MLKIILSIIGIIIALIGVIMIYDAREVTKKLFGFGDQNEAALGLKIAGFLVSAIGAIIIYFNV